ncbi:MAG TPA: branched-chain amino acid ABC transporter permease [Archaeoglobus profundus]|nr:branched-chain amino acid ABC transporter permease [Archaeoglobus profundus]
MGFEYTLVTILIWFGLYLIVALSLNIEYGYGGIPNFGRALAVLIGGIVVGGILNRIFITILGVSGDFISASNIAISKINDIIIQNPIIGIGLLLLSLLIAGIVGFIIGAIFILPSAKLSSDYLAIALLAISEVVFLISYYNPEIIGGYYGIRVVNVLAFIPGQYRIFVFAIVILIVAFIIYLLVDRLMNTPYGRLLKAMRENEDVLKAFGRDIMMVRIKTVAIGSGIAAIAGALYALFAGNVIATAYNRVEWTFYPFLMVILGGLGNNVGVALGVLIFVTAKILLITYKAEITEFLHLPFEAVWLEYILFGIIMLIILNYKPEGLIKEKIILTPPIKRLVRK